MRLVRSGAAMALAALLAGCGALEASTRREEARQLAWTGPGLGPCLFGGVTERAEEHCALIGFGTEGVLMAVNNKVRTMLRPGGGCADHVAALQRELARHRGLRTEPIYTCPIESRARGECHVSLLVATPGGERFVIDNGAVVADTVGARGVATLAAFEEEVDSLHWVGTPPTHAEIAAAIPDFRPTGEAWAGRRRAITGDLR